MSQHAQNQQVPQSSTTPKPNPSQPKTNKPARPSELARQGLSASSKAGGPDAFARLAEAAASAQAYLNNPKAEKTSIRREPVRLVPDLNELPRLSNQKHDGASGAASHRPRAPRVSAVRQAKNYLRATRSPQFLRSAPNLQRHRRKCAICHHPEREMIEELFVRWHSPEAIANFLDDHDQINWVSIYRHAYALGLDAVRRRNLGYVFENILDNAADATPTAAGVVAAARALGCVTEDGRWVEPEKRILMTTVIRKEEPASTTSSTEQEEPDVPLSASFRERTDGRGPISGLRSSPSDSETGARPSTSRSLPAVAGAGFQNRDFAETSGPVPPPQEEGVRVHAAHVGADYDRPELDRPEFPMQRPTARSGTREIRLPLNSHKTKAKPIPNR